MLKKIKKLFSRKDGKEAVIIKPVQPIFVTKSNPTRSPAAVVSRDPVKRQNDNAFFQQSLQRDAITSSIISDSSSSSSHHSDSGCGYSSHSSSSYDSGSSSSCDSSSSSLD